MVRLPLQLSGPAFNPRHPTSSPCKHVCKLYPITMERERSIIESQHEAPILPSNDVASFIDMCLTLTAPHPLPTIPQPRKSAVPALLHLLSCCIPAVLDVKETDSRAPLPPSIPLSPPPHPWTPPQPHLLFPRLPLHLQLGSPQPLQPLLHLLHAAVSDGSTKLRADLKR